VIQRAAEDLKWDSSPDTYKAIFVAGNEPFTQGPIDPAASCKAAIGKGIIVNTIHCGDEQTGVSTGWKSGAMLADGKFLIIDHNKAVVHVDAPQDAEILKWNEKLNTTYVPIGAEGAMRCAAQVEQDALAAEAKGNAIQQRAVTKASANYFNANWDLVDACKVKDFDWTKLKEEDLPEEMRKLTAEERKEYVAGKQKERTEIQEKIQELSKERAEFVSAKLKERGEDDNTLDKVVVRTVREQAQERGYEFVKE
jgi:Skp family chaperone for outer membrane proteins